MRRSQLFVKTRYQEPADETSKGAQLLIRAGFIHKEMAGVYSYLPFGKQVLANIASVIREEMNKIGGQEVDMSILQNKELWEASDRWDDTKVDNWFKSKLVNGTEVGLGFSHEEPIVNMLRGFTSSHKDFPIYIYQIQTKFRNELRARSGVMRGREFLMKDLYSFSRNQKEHDDFYEKVTQAYMKIYNRLGLGDITYKTFASGGVFSKYSHEFQTLSHVGEDTIYLSKAKKLAINKEVYSDEVLQHLGLKKEDLVDEKAVEVGNIFSLGTKYSDALKLFYTDDNGQRQSIIMGCYGIGVSRLMGLLAEHFADDKGLVWPANVAPFDVYLARLGDSSQVVKEAGELYKRLTQAGTLVLYDDRDASAGEKFADADLIGLPYRLVVSDKTIENKMYELKKRSSAKPEQLNAESLIKALAKPKQS
ncbi:prolyl-tRNA synthetase [Candidatus Saccharibacteria bacterium]|nr:prolyl-tRNA synthetase [Candidatus Saccharibacteria bacterium]